VEADQENRNVIGLGFFETLQNVASWRPHGNKAYEQFFGPMSKQIWSELQTMWAGQSNLMDVIRAELLETKKPLWNRKKECWDSFPNNAVQLEAVKEVNRFLNAYPAPKLDVEPTIVNVVIDPTRL
jgi:hypothetical protein